MPRARPDLCPSCRWARLVPVADRVLRLACAHRWETGRAFCLGYEYEPGTDAYPDCYNGLEAVRKAETCEAIPIPPIARQA